MTYFTIQWQLLILLSSILQIIADIRYYIDLKLLCFHLSTNWLKIFKNQYLNNTVSIDFFCCKIVFSLFSKISCLIHKFIATTCCYY